MSRAAFLNTIRDHPDLDAPRLVFADWLDETGDPVDMARAEFIRVQCELARLPDHDPHHRAMEDREHELLSEHELAWVGELPKYATEWEWRRGFVDDVTLRLEDFNRWDEATVDHCPRQLTLIGNQLPQVRSGPETNFIRPFLSSVRGLDLSVASGGQSHSDCVALIRDLEGYGLNDVADWCLGARVAFPDFPDVVVRLPRPASLRTLNLNGAAETLTDVTLDGEGLPHRLSNVRLVNLAVADCGVRADDLRTLLAAPFADTLTQLDISGNPLAPDAYSAFASARMKLDSLDVSGTPLAGISLEPLLATRACESLTKLEMNGCGSARRNMEVLSWSRFWAQATELRAHSGTIPASTLGPLCGSSGPPALRLLDLADNYLRYDGVKLLCDAPWTDSLTWLALSRNYLDDAACKVLALSRLRNLRTLHLAHNGPAWQAETAGISDIGVSLLASSPALANLRLLTLGYTRISDRAVELILDRAPWRLFGLGIAGNNLWPDTVRRIARSPRFGRLTWLDISGNPALRGRALMPLAESPYLSPLCELDCGGIDMAPEVRTAFRERLGVRFSE